MRCQLEVGWVNIHINQFLQVGRNKRVITSVQARIYPLKIQEGKDT